MMCRKDRTAKPSLKKETTGHRRMLACLLTALVLSADFAQAANAAAPQVQVDETMYVNTDYYGTATQINVVKGCNTNGVARYTDYGSYDKVINMSDKTEPELGDGTVTWEFPKESRRFYYQCTMPRDSVELPWSFDISYKLNGVEKDASQLAGASGQVEIHIKAEPNKKAKAYYRNNMLLSVLVPVDMEKCYSVDAPDSQLQSVGNNTVAAFLALPGEDGEYTVRIGTDHFESIGIIFMMVPGTAGAFGNIKELKEAKDTWRENGDQMYDSVHELLKTMESMKTDVTQLKGGLNTLDTARETVNGSRKRIEALSTQALLDLQSVTDQTVVLIPYLETAQSAVADINDNVNAIYTTLEDTQDELDKLYDRLTGLRNSLENMSQRIGQGISLKEQQEIAAGITKTTKEVQEILDAIEDRFGTGITLADLTEEEIQELREKLENADSFRYDRRRRSKESRSLEDEEDGQTDGADKTPGDTQSNNRQQESMGSDPAAEAQETGADGSKTSTKAQEIASEKASTAAADGREAAGDVQKTEAEAQAAGEKAPDNGSEQRTDGDVTAFSTEDPDGEERALSGSVSSSQAGKNTDRIPESSLLDTLLKSGPSGLPGSGGVSEEDFEEWSDEELDEQADETEEALQALLGTSYPDSVAGMLEQLDAILGNGSGIQSTAQGVIDKVNGVCSDIGTAGRKTAQTLTALRGVTDELVNVIDDTRVLIDTMDSYVPSMLESLAATEELMNRLTRAMNSTHDMLSLVNQTAIAAGDDLDAGTRDSLRGMQKLLDKSLKMLDDTAAVRKAGEGMKSTLDEQLDKFEDENNFLNMDPQADMVSFTSGKNPSPHSLQIIVRTDEISDDDAAVSLADLEEADNEDVGPFTRMWRVIVKIFEAIIDIFKNR